jgi:hypothetical protein
VHRGGKGTGGTVGFCARRPFCSNSGFFPAKILSDPRFFVSRQCYEPNSNVKRSD